jgi:hypothetical protein
MRWPDAAIREGTGRLPDAEASEREFRKRHCQVEPFRPRLGCNGIKRRKIDVDDGRFRVPRVANPLKACNRHESPRMTEVYHRTAIVMSLIEHEASMNPL